MEAIISTIIGIFSAALGYFYREYQNKAKPFIKVSGIEGSLMKLTDFIEINESIFGELEDTFYIKKLFPKSSVDSLNEARKKCQEIKAYWPDTKKEIEKLLTFIKEEEIIDKLASLLSSEQLKNWILLLLIMDKIKIEKNDEEKPDRISVYTGEENNGEIWFAFPGFTKSFGRSFKNEAIRAKCEPFISIIRKLDIEKIKLLLKEVIKILDREFQAAISVVHELDEILHEESRWAFYVYVANLTKHPLILKNVNKIIIKDIAKTEFDEELYTSVISDYKGKSYIKDAKYPLIIPPQDNITFMLITRKVQREMERGKALREAFEKERAKYRLILNIEKIGLIKRQKIKSKFEIFKTNK